MNSRICGITKSSSGWGIWKGTVSLLIDVRVSAGETWWVGVTRLLESRIPWTIFTVSGCSASLLWCQLRLLVRAFVCGLPTYPRLAQSMVASEWLDFLHGEVAPKGNVSEELSRSYMTIFDVCDILEEHRFFTSHTASLLLLFNRHRLSH